MNPLVKKVTEKVIGHEIRPIGADMSVALDIGNAIYEAVSAAKFNPNFNLKGEECMDENTIGNFDVPSWNAFSVTTFNTKDISNNIETTSEENSFYQIKKLDNSEIDRNKCDTVIEHHKGLIEKPSGVMDWWTTDRLCKYEGKFIWFKDEGEGEIFRTINLQPYEVSEEFFNKKVQEWKNEGCGYYVII
jgi:hypothetical protein